MTIVLLTSGTRGDVQPFIALGQELRRSGAEVRVAAPESFADFVTRSGLEHTPVRGDVAAIASSELARKARQADTPLKFVTGLRNPELREMLQKSTEDLYHACEGADAIVWHPGAAIGFFAAEAMGAASVLASPFPIARTAEYPSLLFYKGYDGRASHRLWNRLTHLLFEKGLWTIAGAPVRAFWRREIGALPDGFRAPYSRQSTPSRPTIVSCSPEVFPRPADRHENVHMDGYWFPDEDTSFRPSPALERWLESGPKPVYIGFGSIADPDAATFNTSVALEALERTGQRGLLARGWGGLAEPEPGNANVFVIDSAPHDWLFPRMRAVVHHGGAGTSAAAFRAGVPSVIVPHANDQFAWARRAHELGVAAEPIRRKELSADRLTAALLQCEVSRVPEAAAELGARIRAENGRARAAQVVLRAIECHRAERHQKRGPTGAA